MAIRWRSPPERAKPFSPTMRPYPPGWDMMKSWAFASFAAATTCSCVASNEPYLMLFSTVSLKSSVSCITAPTSFLRSATATSRRSTPSIATRPFCGSKKRARSPLRVDLPEPVPPTTATILPRGMSNVARDTAS